MARDKLVVMAAVVPLFAAVVIAVAASAAGKATLKLHFVMRTQTNGIDDSAYRVAVGVTRPDGYIEASSLTTRVTLSRGRNTTLPMVSTSSKGGNEQAPTSFIYFRDGTV